MPISKEQWADIEKTLTGLFACVEFRFSGRLITVQRVTISEGKRQLAVYIDGTIKGGNTSESYEHFDPIVKQVWRTRTHSYYKEAEKKQIYKLWGKREARKRFEKLEAKQISYDPCFTTAKSLVRQFKKLEGIELVEPEVANG